MAQINAPKPIVTQRAPADDVAHDTLHTGFDRAQMFFEEHRTPILGALVGLVVLVAAVLGWRYWQAQRSAEGQQALGAAISLYESGNYRQALDGTETVSGLLELADRYGSTPTGEQARFLAANAHFQLGEMDEALALFEAYDGDGLLEASAIAGQAAVYESRGDHARAAALYLNAARAFESPASSPRYYLDAARAFAAAGDAEAAQEALQTVADEYAETPEAQTAATEMGRVAAMASATGQATGTVQPLPDTTATVSADGSAEIALPSGAVPVPDAAVRPAPAE